MEWAWSTAFGHRARCSAQSEVEDKEVGRREGVVVQDRHHPIDQAEQEGRPDPVVGTIPQLPSAERFMSAEPKPRNSGARGIHA